MNDNEQRYEEYKASLMHSTMFFNKVKETCANTIQSEADFIDRHAIFAKTGILFAVSSFFLSWFLSLEYHTSVGSVIFRIFLAVVSIISFFKALQYTREFKDLSGRSNFKSFCLPELIRKRVQDDRHLAMSALVSDLYHNRISRDDFCSEFRKLEDFDRYADRLMDDFEFNTALHKQMKDWD